MSRNILVYITDLLNQFFQFDFSYSSFLEEAEKQVHNLNVILFKKQLRTLFIIKMEPYCAEEYYTKQHSRN